MSLTRALMNGGTFGVSGIDASKYGHDNGASRIAIESIEELHEVFIESFYNTEQAELAAATEGVALEGSQYEVVYEGAISSAFEKIKVFLKKLWEKVKAFFHNVKRYIDSIFMSGKDFAKKYKKDIQDADKKLKDFSYTMFKYDDDLLDSVDKDFDVAAGAEGIVATAQAETDKFRNEAAKMNAQSGVTIEQAEKNFEKALTDYKKTIEEDELVKDATNNKCTDMNDLDEVLFGLWRNGATDKEDKEEIDITSLDHYLNILTESKALSNVDSMISKTDKMFQKAIKAIGEMEKSADKSRNEIKGDGATDKSARLSYSYISKFASAMSTGVSRSQSIMNRIMTSWKTALKERDTVYKQVLLAGIANARKNK